MPQSTYNTHTHTHSLNCNENQYYVSKCHELSNKSKTVEDDRICKRKKKSNGRSVTHTHTYKFSRKTEKWKITFTAMSCKREKTTTRCFTHLTWCEGVAINVDLVGLWNSLCVAWCIGFETVFIYDVPQSYNFVSYFWLYSSSFWDYLLKIVLSMLFIWRKLH